MPLIYRDERLLVINKPAGLLTVPGKAAEHSDCLESRVQTVLPEARIVHRLDMDTSGIIVLAMDAAALRHVGLQFEKRYTAKAYRALVFGEMQDDTGEVNLPLVCDWPNRPKQMVDHKYGKSACTRWRVLGRKAGRTLVELTPVTGRSHQLRVHMKELGHPILGDRFYAEGEALAAADRLMLHARMLEIHHPDDGRRIRFEAPEIFDLNGCKPDEAEKGTERPAP